MTFRTVESVAIGVAVAVIATGVWTILHEINRAMERNKNEKPKR